MFLPQVGLGDGFFWKFGCCKLVSPVPECPLRVLHYVSLVDKGDGIPVVLYGVSYGLSYQSEGACLADGLYPNSRVRTNLCPKLLFEKVYDLFCLRALCRPLYAGINVFGVLPEDDHIYQFRPFYRAWHTLEISHGSNAGIEIKDLSQGHVKASYSLAHRGCQRAFYCNHVFGNGVQRLLGEVLTRLFLGLFTCIYLFPRYGAFSIVCLFNRGIQNHSGGPPDVWAYPVTFYERYYGIVRHVDCAIWVDCYLLTGHLLFPP